MPTLLGIHGSVTQPGRLHQVLQVALQSVDGALNGGLSAPFIEVIGAQVLISGPSEEHVVDVIRMVWATAKRRGFCLDVRPAGGIGLPGKSS